MPHNPLRTFFVPAILSVVLVLLLSPVITTAQQPQETNWSTDVIIDNSPTVQTLPKICVAQNGYIFAGFIYSGGYHIAVSKDDGSTWSTWADYAYQLTDWDLAVTGTNGSNLLVWLAGVYPSNQLGVYTFDSTGNYYFQTGYTAPTGTTLENVAMATSYKNPGTADSAGSFGVAVALTTQGVNTDSTILFGTNDGGKIWNSVTAATASRPLYFHRISMSYMHSATFNYGNYFIAGEYSYSQTITDTANNIYYYYVDGKLANPSYGTNGFGYVTYINPAWKGSAGQPNIITENSATDNDSDDISTLILFNTSVGLRGISTMEGYVNSATPDAWVEDDIISGNLGVATPGEGVFDPAFNNFIFTAGNLNTQTLSYYVCNENNVNFQGSSDWTPFYANYSDGSYSLIDPQPQCDINPTDTKAVADWIGGANTYTLFDAEDRTTGIAPTGILPLVKVYPSPADQYVNITLPAAFNGTTKIEVYNLLGQNMFTQLQTQSPSLQINTGQWPSGNYYVRLTCGGNEQVKKFTVARQ